MQGVIVGPLTSAGRSQSDGTAADRGSLRDGRWRAVGGGSALGGRGRAGWSTALNRISERVIYSDPEVLVALAGHGARNRSDRVYCSVGGRGGVR